MAGEIERTTPPKRVDLDLTDKENLILMEEYLLVTEVKDSTPDDAPIVGVEVRAENRYRGLGEPFWRSLRYQCLPEDAPRARDVIRILVLRVGDSPPPGETTAEQEPKS